MMLALIANAAVRALLLGVVAWLALRLARVRNPHVETLVWRFVLAAGVALPMVLAGSWAPRFDSAIELPVLSTAAAGALGDPRSFTAEMGWPMAVLATIYLGGVALLLARLVVGLARLRRIVRSAEVEDDSFDVRVSPLVRSPATVGRLVLLPVESRTWAADRLAAVLAHERAHVRSRDAHWSWVARVHTAIFWFSPLAWWLQARLDWLAETTSDDAVVAARHDPLEYAALLLDFARQPNPRSLAMSIAESNVSKRIQRLLDRIPPAVELPRAASWAAAALLVPVVALAAATTSTVPVANAPQADATAPHPSFTAIPDPDDYYPAVARDEHVEGLVVIEANLDAHGRLIDARVVRVDPADPRFGFGDAGLQVARNAKYANPLGRPTPYRFMVKFALTDH